jgi:hypothetical protein
MRMITAARPPFAYIPIYYNTNTWKSKPYLAKFHRMLTIEKAEKVKWPLSYPHRLVRDGISSFFYGDLPKLLTSGYKNGTISTTKYPQRRIPL